MIGFHRIVVRRRFGTFLTDGFASLFWSTRFFASTFFRKKSQEIKIRVFKARFFDLAYKAGYWQGQS